MAKTDSKPGSKRPSKTAFILSFPLTTSAREIVAKGKAAGLKLTDRYVYVIRSKAKRRTSRSSDGVSARGKGSSPVQTVRRGSGTHQRTEEILRTAGALLGFEHAISVLEAEKARVFARLRNAWDESGGAARV